MGIIQRLLENGTLKRVKRFRREVWSFGTPQSPEKAKVVGMETLRQEDPPIFENTEELIGDLRNKGSSHYTAPASLLEITLTFDVGDEELNLSNKHQIGLLEGRIRYSLFCLLENLEEEIEKDSVEEKKND